LPVESLALILVAFSCITHAAWNLICKHCGTSPTFFLLANLIVVVCGWPVLLACTRQELAAIPGTTWTCLIITGIFQAGYFAFLAFAYRTGDVSLVYPIARLAPVFVIMAEAFFFRRVPASLPTAGIILAACGCFVLSKGPPTLAGQTARLPASGRAILWAVATAVASAGYTLTDFIGVHATFRAIPELRGSLVYGYLEWASTTLMLVPVVWLLDRRKPVRQVWREQRGPILAVAILCYVTYTLILWAFAHSQQAAYVAGFRQLSVVLGVVGGALLLKERVGFRRVLGVVAITAGLVLIAFA
jgi:drug/metabolite transporter (DMT)-like permease